MTFVESVSVGMSWAVKNQFIVLIVIFLLFVGALVSLRKLRAYTIAGFVVLMVVLFVYFYAANEIYFKENASADESPISNVTGLIGEYLIYLDIGEFSKGSSSADIAGVMGTFGDFIGGTLNPILTFLTFICLLITIHIQRTELKDSRVEFKKTAESLEFQEIQDRVFNLISRNKEIVRSMRLNLSLSMEPDEINGFKGNKVFNSFISDGDTAVGIDAVNILPFILLPVTGKSDRWSTAFDFILKNSHCYDSYFKSLIDIIMNIESIDGSVSNKYYMFKHRLMESFKSSLSSKELAFLLMKLSIEIKNENAQLGLLEGAGVCLKETDKKIATVISLVKKYKIFDCLYLKIKDGLVVFDEGIEIMEEFERFLDLSESGEVIGFGAFSDVQLITIIQLEHKLKEKRRPQKADGDYSVPLG